MYEKINTKPRPPSLLNTKASESHIVKMSYSSYCSVNLRLTTSSLHLPQTNDSDALYKKHISCIKIIQMHIESILPPTAQIGVTAKTNDSFFEAVAQILNKQKTSHNITYSVESLRGLSYNYATELNKKYPDPSMREQWIVKELDDDPELFHEYIDKIKYSRDANADILNSKANIIKGNINIDGCIIAESLNIALHIIHLKATCDDNYRGQMTITHELIKPDRSKHNFTANTINYEDQETIHLVEFNNYFLPIILPNPLQLKPTAASLSNLELKVDTSFFTSNLSNFQP